MTNSIDKIEDFALSLPIDLQSRSIAQSFADEQPNPEKAEQVFLNTLAVCTMNAYLQMLGFSTDLNNSYSWNPVARLCADIADLEVTGIGKLECRPIKSNELICKIPLEVLEDRVGYVIVEIDNSLRKARLLGFTPTVETEELPLDRLQSPEKLIEHLHEIPRQVRQNLITSPSLNKINLSQWLDNIFVMGWQTVESLLNPNNLTPAFSFRSNDLDIINSIENEPEENEADVRQAKLIDLQLQLASFQVVLVVELKVESPQKTDIYLQVYPIKTQPFLPPGLQLIVLDESGIVFMEGEARQMDNYMQLQFSGQPGESFSVTVALENASFTENFII